MKKKANNSLNPRRDITMHRYNLIESILFPPTHIIKNKLRNSLKGKTILITGASSGIGEQVAYLLGDTNSHLILVARREDKLQQIKHDIEKKSTASVSVIRADLRNKEDLETLLNFLHQLPDGLDIVISNAGHSIQRPILHSLDRFHDVTRTMNINFFAPVQLLLSVIPLLHKKQGQIINVSTINALLIPFPFWAAYQASKSAFDTWFRSAAPELNAIGITTTTIYLPLVKTPMSLPTAAYQHAPAMSAQHAAKLIGKAILLKKRNIRPWWLINGQLGSILFRGLYEKLMPKIIKKRGKSH
jgi:short-subunit dehydrogenase